MRYEYPSHQEMVVNLLDHFESSNFEGTVWYRESQRYARKLARDSGLKVSQCAGIIAALSPQVQWDMNKRLAAEVVSTGTCRGLRLSVDRAERIYAGGRPLDVLRGPKTRAFYRAIMGNENSAVIDTWMCYAMGMPHSQLTAKRYELCAAALREAASYTDLTTAKFQAVVWTHVRGGGD